MERISIITDCKIAIPAQAAIIKSITTSRAKLAEYYAQDLADKFIIEDGATYDDILSLFDEIITDAITTGICIGNSEYSIQNGGFLHNIDIMTESAVQNNE